MRRTRDYLMVHSRCKQMARPVAVLDRCGRQGAIDTFDKSVTGGVTDNPTLDPSINATLTAILGREAARRKAKMTLDEVLRENRRLEPDLTGLKA